MTILIDNGHGSDTPVKRSPDGLFRKYSYTREIARRVVSELSDCGYDARLLVHEIEDIPLQERCRRVKAICDEVGMVNVILYAKAGMPKHKFKFTSETDLRRWCKPLEFNPLNLWAR